MRHCEHGSVAVLLFQVHGSAGTLESSMIDDADAIGDQVSLEHVVGGDEDGRVTLVAEQHVPDGAAAEIKHKLNLT